MMALTGTKNSFTFGELVSQAMANCIGLVKLYNAHAFVGDMQQVAERTVWKLAKPGMTYTREEAEDILAEADYDVRDLVLDH